MNDNPFNKDLDSLNELYNKYMGNSKTPTTHSYFKIIKAVLTKAKNDELIIQSEANVKTKGNEILNEFITSGFFPDEIEGFLVPIKSSLINLNNLLVSTLMRLMK